MHEQHSPEYRTVAVFGSLADAELVRGMLEADGIAAAVLDGIDAALLPGAGTAVRVLVPARDLSRAREILAGPEDGPVTDDAEDDELVAPSHQAERPWAINWIVLLLLAALISAVLVL